MGVLRPKCGTSSSDIIPDLYNLSPRPSALPSPYHPLMSLSPHSIQIEAREIDSHFVNENQKIHRYI
jgi:hypothetical protein|uniref:Uncharacterized protein n=1 Tax=Picea glauca TaxID=3330 RepID=A0A117NGE5_PICGL|nr:hypothetical protein ABT39_MTgene1365 [Picea glauca]QHR89482.1 hypothetical protein Q903MT_gene3503 [Picea sitchensis]